MTGCNSADYNRDVEAIREREYPMLKGESFTTVKNTVLIIIDAVYLDHAGTTLYSKSLMEQFAVDMISNLCGNPHSASASSQLSTQRIEDIRLRVLLFSRADPEKFDVVFVANATAGIKLVMEGFRNCEGSFEYRYHQDAHTSLVGVRESAASSLCLSDHDVDVWLSGSLCLTARSADPRVTLFAYPAQSNMNGKRLPLAWSARARSRNGGDVKVYTLLDAAAFASTAQLDLSDFNAAPDFTVLSFYKIFGFPDLGALIVRKESGNILHSRRYFGGGTVDMAVSAKEQWHVSKSQTLYESLEDGTLPIHNIMALDIAMKLHAQFYGSMDRISKHTSYLAKRLFDALHSLQHGNGAPVCELYHQSAAFGGNSQSQGAVVAFNLRNSHGAWMSNAEVEKLASVHGIHIRTGGLCNPGGLATALGLEPWEMRRNFSAGFLCGNDNDVIAGKPMGMIRASLGAMSTIQDVDRFVNFIREFYVEGCKAVTQEPASLASDEISGLFIESLTIYPIKSCGGFAISEGVDWEVRKEGLAWDREWCLLHQGTGQALSQKRYPVMALIHPILDFEAGLLRIRYRGELPEGVPDEVAVPLSQDPNVYKPLISTGHRTLRVCGDAIVAQPCSSGDVNNFFTRILNVPCTLARFPAGGHGPSTRHSKAHMQKHQRSKAMSKEIELPGAYPSPPTPPESDTETSRPILLSNESPILLINRASIDALNDEIRKTGGKVAHPTVFRANVIVSSRTHSKHHPYSEDHWSTLRIGQQEFRMLGSCRRCHMVCVDQSTAIKDVEPFVTLVKTRRFDGKVFFGSHMCHVSSATIFTKEQQYPTIRVGDPVTATLGWV
jgi:molybdenum cofactor sulfurtransferase